MKILTSKNVVLLCLILMSFIIKANEVSETKISLNFTDQTLETVLDDITAKTNFTFVYKNSEFDNQKKVTFNLTDSPLADVLSAITKEQGMKYVVRNNQIMFVKLATKSEKITLSGQVVDEFGVGLPGVNVIIQGTVIGQITDVDGNFNLSASGTNIGKNLSFTSIGYMEKLEVIEGSRTYNITMVEEAIGVDEVVVVAFGEQKKESMMASIESIKASELKVPTSNLTTALGGRVAGLMSYQRTGEPGKDNAEFFIRGATTFGYAAKPLYLIDGIEMEAEDLARISPDDIETFNVMKDAVATSLYGARGANGVIYVTTKNGVQGDTKISVRMETSLSRPTTEVEMADAVTYMNMYNEAIYTRDRTAPLRFSQSKIAATQRGDNPILYPNVDWQDELFKDYTLNQRVSMNISGGGSKANYYVSVGVTNDNGVLKEVGEKNFNSNINLQKYTVRSNINVEIFPNTKLSTKFQVDFDDYEGPLEGGSDIYGRVMRTSPVGFLPYYPKDASNSYINHVLFGSDPNEPDMPNPYADMVKGYKESDKTNLQGKIDLEYDFQGSLKGLKLKTTFSTTRYSYYEVKRSYNPFYYYPIYNKEEKQISYTYDKDRGGTEFLTYSPGNKDLSTKNYFEGRLTYVNTFDDKHDLNLLAVAYLSEYKIGNPPSSLDGENLTLNDRLIVSLPSRNIGFSGRVAYTYDARYSAEFTFGYNGSERFSEDKRFGFFPAIGAGWNLHNESFFESLTDIVTKFKLKATYGIIGQDEIGKKKDRFFYMSNVNLSGPFGYVFGEDYSESGRTVSIDRYANNEITWEESYKYDLGFELKLFKDLEIKMDYFGENRKNIFRERVVPTSVGLSSGAFDNTGEAKSWGWDGSLVYNKSFFNGYWIQARANLTVTDHEITLEEEPDYSYLQAPWKSAVGYRIGQPRGLIAERLFIDQADVDNSPVQSFGPYGEGDIKYKDVNKDGKVSSLDEVPIGFPKNALIQYGFGFSFGNDDFDISMFFQGSAEESFWLDVPKVAPFNNKNQVLQVWADDYWSEKNRNPYAKWPRLSPGLSENNSQTSTWFMHDASYIRLKSVELGYNLPEELVKSFLLTKFRVYASGSNLYTWSKFDLWDPEMGANAFAYPLQQVFNLGLQIQF
jgi:TonB-linked SusC/RagA family outer membrane protein